MRVDARVEDGDVHTMETKPWGLSVRWAAKAKYHRLRGLNNRSLFHTVLESGSPGLRSAKIWLLVKACFLACRRQPSHCALTQQRTFLWAHDHHHNHNFKDKNCTYIIHGRTSLCPRWQVRERFRGGVSLL